MTRQRRDEFVVEVETQTSLIVEKTGTITILEPTAASPYAIKRALLEDKRSTGRKKGKLAPIRGLFKGVTATLSTYAEGTRAVATTPNPAVATALSKLIASVSQDITSTKASVVGAGPSAAAVVDSVNDGHLTAAPNGSTAAITMVAVEMADGYHVRSGTFNPANETITFRQQLPGIPAIGAELLAGHVFQNAEQWDTLPYPVTVRFLGNDAEQNAKAIGCVAGLAIPEANVEDVPELNFTLNIAHGSSGFVDARPAAADPLPEVSVWAGGEVLLNPYGDDTYNSVCAKVGVEGLGGGWNWLSCPGSPANPYGIQNWMRGENTVKVTVTVPHDVFPSDMGAGTTLERWLDIVEDNTGLQPEDKEWQLQVQWGFTPGRIAAAYFPRLVLQSVSDGELDGTEARVLVFEPHPNSLEASWCMLLS